MAYKLFQEVALRIDIPENDLKKGDVATIVEYHPIANEEDGYTLEIFNALGETIDVITVAESSIEPIRKDEIFNVRSLSVA